jgi:5'-deoxynucleotidase YfbR-like HD superfamily hydrolase
MMNAPIKPTVSFELQVPDLAAIINGLSLSDLLKGVHSPGYPDRLGHYQYTHTGRIFFPCDPRAEEVFIEDIAVPASRISRFNGQTEKIITDAEHQWHASFMVPREEALEALLHDGSESYIGDMIRPLKVLPIFGSIYLMIERGIEAQIAKRFKLTHPWSHNVKRADEILCHADIAQNIRSKEHGVHFDTTAFDADKEATPRIEFQYWQPALAEKMYLDRFYELSSERGVR